MSCRGALAVVACAGALLLAPGQAAAADYTAGAFGCGGGPRERGGGQSDAAGNFYIACEYDGAVVRSHIRIHRPDGTLARIAPVAFPADGKRSYMSDVAPSPDGRFLYVARHDTHTYHRLVRQLDGSYVLDLGWRLANYQLWGMQWVPLGEFVATDAAGDIYVTTGTWAAGPTNVVKYAPDGTVITRFGDWERSHRAGIFYWMLGGLSVTPDGGSIYTVEVGNNRVQRFDRRADGSYTFALEWGNTAADDAVDNPATAADESRPGICYRAGKFAAPYDVALDRQGFVYVINTTCFENGMVEVQKFTRDGAWVWSHQARALQWERAHAIAVDGLGNIYLAQARLVLRPNQPRAPVDPAPVEPAPVEPAPVDPAPVQPAPVDMQAPVLRDFTLPALVTTQVVTITIDAVDDVGVTELRYATETGNWEPWRAFATPTQVTLTPFLGIARKGINIQVRDAARRESTVLYRMTNFQPGAVPAPAPVPEPQPAPQPLPQPGPNQPPAVQAVRMPNPTASQLVPVHVDATDDRGITHVRVANEDGRWGAWREWSPDFTHLLTPKALIKGITVEVRDADGATARGPYTKTLCTPCTPPPPEAEALRLRHARLAVRAARARGGRYRVVRLNHRRNRVRLGRGTQHVDASHLDRKRDIIDCGPGFDTVLRRREDRTRNCELVRVVRAPR